MNVIYVIHHILEIPSDRTGRSIDVAKRQPSSEGDPLVCYGPRAVSVSTSTQISFPKGALAEVGITSERVLVFGDPENHRLIVTREPSAAEQHDLATRGSATS
jgi:hypothetical protein